jgi:hypothetical protein
MNDQTIKHLENETEVVEGQTKAVSVYKGEATVEFDLSTMLPTVGTLDITDEQKAILFAPMDELDVEIRPDGMIYAPWTIYAQRLHKAFPMAWGLIPQGLPKINGTLVIWGFHLIIKGKYMGFVIGENNYQPTNRMMSFGDCAEGAKSNAITRLCKQAGMSLELWDKSYYMDWQKKYAETFIDKDKREKWRKKAEFVRHPLNQTAAVENDTHLEETGRADGLTDNVSETAKQPAFDKKVITIWNGKVKIADEKIGTKATNNPLFQKEFSGHVYFKAPVHFTNHLEKHFGVKHPEDLTWDMLNALYNHINKLADDPRWYTEEKVVEPLSGWQAHHAAKGAYEAKGASALYEDITTKYATRLGSASPKWGKALTDIAEAIGVVYDLPITAEAKAEIFAKLDKDIV